MRKRGTREAEAEFGDYGGRELHLDFGAREETGACGVVLFVEGLEPAHVLAVEHSGDEACELFVDSRAEGAVVCHFDGVVGALSVHVAGFECVAGELKPIFDPDSWGIVSRWSDCTHYTESSGSISRKVVRWLKLQRGEPSSLGMRFELVFLTISKENLQSD